MVVNTHKKMDTGVRFEHLVSNPAPSFVSCDLGQVT